MVQGGMGGIGGPVLSLRDHDDLLTWAIEGIDAWLAHVEAQRPDPDD